MTRLKFQAGCFFTESIIYCHRVQRVALSRMLLSGNAVKMHAIAWMKCALKDVLGRLSYSPEKEKSYEKESGSGVDEHCAICGNVGRMRCKR